MRYNGYLLLINLQDMAFKFSSQDPFSWLPQTSDVFCCPRPLIVKIREIGFFYMGRQLGVDLTIGQA